MLTSNAYVGNMLILQCGFGGVSKKLDDLKAVADWFILLECISNFLNGLVIWGIFVLFSRKGSIDLSGTGLSSVLSLAQ